MFMLHKTFGAPKAGGGPAVGAYGCTELLAPYLPGPLVTFDGERYRLTDELADGIGRVREFLGNVPRDHQGLRVGPRDGRRGHRRASDLSVLANNYMEQKLLADPRRDEVASAAHGAAARDDALQPRAT